MNREDIIRMAREAGFYIEHNEIYSMSTQSDQELTEPIERFAALVASAERAFCHQLMLDFIEEFMGYEKDRHPMFSEGYDLALFHMKKLIEGDRHD
jgi:recombinational DNA repair protein (RecF pathway)